MSMLLGLRKPSNSKFNKVVDETSACIDGYRKVPLPTDHLKINKYSGPHDPSYIAVYPSIVDVAQNAKRIVQDRLNRKHIGEFSGTLVDISLGSRGNCER